MSICIQVFIALAVLLNLLFTGYLQANDRKDVIFKRYVDEDGLEVIQVDTTGTYNRKTVCYPPNWGGIVIGITQEKDLITLYGEGLYDNKQPHLGVRYYSDVGGQITVAVWIGVDHVIDAVTISTGKRVPAGFSSNDPKFISERVDPKERFLWGELSLDSTRDQVQLYLGTPARKNAKLDTWTYFTDYTSKSCHIGAGVTFQFLEDKVESITFFNGE